MQSMTHHAWRLHYLVTPCFAALLLSGLSGCNPERRVGESVESGPRRDPVVEPGEAPPPAAARTAPVQASEGQVAAPSRTVLLPPLRSTILENLDASVQAVLSNPRFVPGSDPILLRYKFSPGETLDMRGAMRARQRQAEGAPEVSITARMAFNEVFGVPDSGWVPVTRTMEQLDFDFPPDMPQEIENEIERVLRGFKVSFETDTWGKTRNIEILTPVEPAYLQLIDSFMEDIRNPLVIFPEGEQRPGDSWVIKDTEEEDGITTYLQATYTYRGRTESPVLKPLAFISLAMEVKVEGTIVEMGSQGTINGGGTGRGAMLLDMESGQATAVWVEMKMQQRIRGKEWGQDVEIQQDANVEMVVQRI